jgi:hypothetical protein
MQKKQRLNKTQPKKKNSVAKPRPRPRPTNGTQKERNTRPNRVGGTLSSCSVAYARALTDPYADLDPLPCIPDTVVLGSYKLRTYGRGTFTIGTAGVGWIIVAPHLCSVSSNRALYVGYTDDPIITTTAAYTGTNLNYVPGSGPAYPTGVQGSNPNSIYAYTDLAQASNRQIRLVGCGLRARYTGTELNRGGRVFLLRQPNNGSIVNAQTGANLTKEVTCTTAPVSRTWHHVEYKPEAAQEISYLFNDTWSYINGQPVNTPTDFHSMLIYVEGAVAGSAFEFEVVSYFELIGTNLQLTQSHSDPVGMGVVSAAVPIQSPEKPSPSVFKQVLRTAVEMLGTMVSTSNPMAGLAVDLARQMVM